MGENEETPQTIPSLDDVDEGMTDEQRERQSRQPGAGSAGEAAPEDDPASTKEPAKIGDQDQVKGRTASPGEPSP
jgi:hypothetical protein